MTRQLKLGAVLLGAGGPGDHHTWRNPEIPGDASVDITFKRNDRGDIAVEHMDRKGRVDVMID